MRHWLLELVVARADQPYRVGAIGAPGHTRTQVLARDLVGAKGVHVAYITIDAAIDTPWVRIPFHPDKSDEFFNDPDAIAEEVFHVAHRGR